MIAAVDRAVGDRAGIVLRDDGLRDDEEAAIAAVLTDVVGGIRPRD